MLCGFWLGKNFPTLNFVDVNDVERWPWSSSWLRWRRRRRRSSNRYFEKYLQSSSRPSTQTTKNLNLDNGSWRASRGNIDKLGRFNHCRRCFIFNVTVQANGSDLDDLSWFLRPESRPVWGRAMVRIFRGSFSNQVKVLFTFPLSLSLSLSLTHTHTHAYIGTPTPTLAHNLNLSLFFSPFLHKLLVVVFPR